MIAIILFHVEHLDHERLEQRGELFHVEHYFGKKWNSNFTFRSGFVMFTCEHLKISKI